MNQAQTFAQQLSDRLEDIDVLRPEIVDPGQGFEVFRGCLWHNSEKRYIHFGHVIEDKMIERIVNRINKIPLEVWAR
jgi:hypothetical protein